MDSISTLFANSAFTLMALCAFLLIGHSRKNHSIALFCLLLVCACCYLISDVFGQLTLMSAVWWIEYIASNALPGVFWLTCISMFSENRDLKRWQYVVASLTCLIPVTATLVQLAFAFDLRIYPAFYGLIKYGALALELVLLFNALSTIVLTWQADLVQERRNMRSVMLTFIAVYIVAMIIVEQLFEWQWNDLSIIKYSVLLAIAVTVSTFLFSLKPNSVFEIETAAEEDQEIDSVIKEPSPELESVVESMLVEHLYREEGMTITALSKHLAIHEYRLRQLINGELAYRNFNDFLNFYRIQEVSQKLEEKTLQKVPVLTLALESGFRSLSSFNKAFKGTHGITPTEYRHRMLMKHEEVAPA